jgi:hypothetical protein
MRALIAPDKFKGSLTARQVADAIAHGLHTAGIETVILPLADGGDGSVEAALSAGYHRCQTQVRGADGRTVNAVYALGKRTAVVEVANTCGLSTLPAGVRAPMTSSTFGFGEAILAAYHAGARRIVLALGGSASTDGGAGMLAALGVVLLDDHGNTVEPDGAGLSRIARVDTTNMVDLSDVEVIVAGDVTNPSSAPPEPPPPSAHKRAPTPTRSPPWKPASPRWSGSCHRFTTASPPRWPKNPEPAPQEDSASPAAGSVASASPAPTTSSTSSTSTRPSTPATSSSPEKAPSTTRPSKGSSPPS